MHTLDSTGDAGTRPRQFAPLWHTALLLGVLAPASILGGRMQARALAGGGIIPARAGAPMALYLETMLFECVLLALAWWGSRLGGTSVRQLIGGRWNGVRPVLTDLGIAAVYFVVVTATVSFVSTLLGPSGPNGVNAMLPHGAVQVATWCLLAATAAFVEEQVYRGYLLRQLTAWTGSAALAVTAQAVVFGAGHLYQGVKPAIAIGAFGLLAGLLAMWRKSLRPGMIGHFLLVAAVAFAKH